MTFLHEFNNKLIDLLLLFSHYSPPLLCSCTTLLFNFAIKRYLNVNIWFQRTARKITVTKQWTYTRMCPALRLLRKIWANRWRVHIGSGRSGELQRTGSFALNSTSSRLEILPTRVTVRVATCRWVLPFWR